MAQDDADTPRPAGLSPTERSIPTWVGLTGGAPESVIEADWGVRDEPREEVRQGLRAMGRHALRVAALALLVCLALAALLHTLADAPHIAAQWRADAHGRLELASTTDPALRAQVGQTLSGVAAANGNVELIDGVALQRTSRWVIQDAERTAQQAMQAALTSALASGTVHLYFDDGYSVEVRPVPRGWAGIPAATWLLCAIVLALGGMALHVLLTRLTVRNIVYATLALLQAGNLALIAAESAFEFGLPAPLLRWGMPLHVGFDLFTAAAMVTAASLHPRRLPGARWIALAAWGVALVLAAVFGSGLPMHAWWWTQLTMTALCLIGIGLLSWSYRIEPHPFAIVLRQFCVVAVATWVLLTLALAAADGLRSVPHNIADSATTVWYGYLAALLLMIPFLGKSQGVLREFVVLAAVVNVAISLYLLLVSVFELGQLPALTLALLASLGAYSTLRQWTLSHLPGRHAPTTERMFEQLYRIAREVEARPERAPALLSQLLGELFDPLEVNIGDLRTRRSRVAGDGSSMLVPLPALGGEDPARSQSILIRFALRGRRLFTAEDARLTDRIVEQLRRAVHFDKAVEQGRREERLRLAQDLHDDIGARLLTLMYKAQSPEMEDYVRHTLQDLKTLTRGLAASNHRLSHAAAEWKTDLTHRLTAAHVQLEWAFEFDVDILLTVVHWSALTRILRELVSNAIAHAQAARVEIDFRLENDRIELTITDDGVGHDPRAWSHGLGLGGVRKRVKQLGGEIEWREVQPHGIGCRVVIRDLSTRWQL